MAVESIAKRSRRAHFGTVDSKEELAPAQPARLWTRPDAYVEALVRRHSARRHREPRPRTQPETPRLLLSTVPFLVLIAALGMLAVAIMIAAYPGAQPPVRVQAPQDEQGMAAKGWFQEAQKDFH